jgi:hypothetical protein
MSKLERNVIRELKRQQVERERNFGQLVSASLKSVSR